MMDWIDSIEGVDIWQVLMLLDELLWTINNIQSRLIPRNPTHVEVDLSVDIKLLDELLDEAHKILDHTS